MHICVLNTTLQSKQYYDVAFKAIIKLFPFHLARYNLYMLDMFTICSDVYARHVCR